MFADRLQAAQLQEHWPGLLVGAEWQHRHSRRNRADLYGCQIAVHAGHGDIENNQAQLRGVLACQLDTRNAVARPKTLIARKGALGNELILRTARQINCHGRAVSWTAFDLDTTTVLLNDLGAGREPET